MIGLNGVPVAGLVLQQSSILPELPQPCGAESELPTDYDALFAGVTGHPL